MSVDVHLPVDIYSPDQLSELLSELRGYIGQQRDFAVRSKVSKRKSAESPEVPKALASLLHSSHVAKDDTAGLEALLKALESTLKTAPIMHITLAAPPGRTLKRQLAVWFRTQVHPQALLTFAARSDIGGGFLLQAGSHFYDHSFRSRILAHKARLAEIAGV